MLIGVLCSQLKHIQALDFTISIRTQTSSATVTSRSFCCREDSVYELEDQTSKALILPLLLKMLNNASRGLFVYHLHQNTTKDDIQGFFDPKADVVPLVLAVLIISINSVVLVLMSRKRHLRSNTNLLLGSLALSDLLTGLVSVPLFSTCNIVRQSAICVSEEQMSRFISASIVCHLMSVTVDRYLAILHPLRYASLVTRPPIALWSFSSSGCYQRSQHWCSLLGSIQSTTT